jgi:nucleoside-diphosphate-sugar epimerase
MAKKVFITGASGCVGHYLVESLLHQTDYELYLLVRSRAKLKIDLSARPDVTVIEDNMSNIGAYKSLLATMNYVVSTAACWGGTEEVFQTNVHKTHELFDALDPEVCDRAIYFSTASILDSHNQLLKEAGAIGTDYIRSKYDCLEYLENSAIAKRLITVFPTLVFGGAADKPYSHISAGLKDIVKYVKFIRFVKGEGSFHFIHASDIAQIITYLLTADRPLRCESLPNRLVMGMPKLTVDGAISEVCGFYNKRIGWQLDLSPGLINLIIKLFKIEVAEWDLFNVKLRHLIYDVVTPETFGLTSKYPRITNLFAEVGDS